MPTILHQLPIADKPTALVVNPREVVTTHSFQVVVWVSVTPHDWTELPPGSPRLPAILDTGHSHNFSIQDRQLRLWPGLAPSALPLLQNVRINRVNVPPRAASLGLPPNRSGQRDRFTGAPPFRLQLPRGIAVYPSDTPGEPRLPLMGLRALVLNNLHL